MFRSVIVSVCALAASSVAFAQKADPEGYLTYSLPNTVIVLEVEAVQENFYAGPYAAFAEKYLGISAQKKDEQTYQLKSVKMTTMIEADQSRRFSVNVSNGEIDARVMKLSSAGLVSMADAFYGEETKWRFPMAADGDFSDMGVSSNVVSESTTLYRNNDVNSRFNNMQVRQDILVEKSLEKKASEMAQKVIDARDMRYNIVTGDTDATYSGEAMQAAIDELTRVEKEYLTLFIGYKTTQTHKMYFEVIPHPGDMQKYIAFRLSDSEGLVPSDNFSGKPIIMEILPQEIADTDVAKEEAKAQADAETMLEETGKSVKIKSPAEKKKALVHYRIPAACTVKLFNGTQLLLQSRVPIYQLGKESSLPVNALL